MEFAVGASKIFNGDAWLHDQVIVVKNGRIIDVVDRDAYKDKSFHFFEEGIIVPAFIDVQVYGAAGRLLAVDPDSGTLELMRQTFNKNGTTLFLPTVATNTIEVFKKCIDAVRSYWENGGQSVWGLHLEGPWLNPEKRGAHVKEWIHSPSVDEVRDLLEYGTDVIKMITIAPEQCSIEVLNLLRSYPVILSAGHSNASYEEATNSFDNGIGAVTHLYNAMSPFQHRAPGLVGAAFMHSSVKASIIPDGIHVDFAAVAIAKKIMGERLFAITDAVTETISGPYRHHLASDRYECNGVLSGSALTMHQAFLNLVNKVGIEAGEALRMCSLYSAQLLGCDDIYGKIVPQAAGQFIVMDNQFALVECLPGNNFH
jgi:N-acetylglucosamine-6-phosphate deacetylase